MKLLTDGGITGVIPPSDSDHWGSIVRPCAQPGCDRIAPAGICGACYRRGVDRLQPMSKYRSYMQHWRWRVRDARRVAQSGAHEEYEG